MELQNFNLIVASMPKEHGHMKYEPNRPGSFNFEYAAGKIEYFPRCGALAENSEIAKFLLDCC